MSVRDSLSERFHSEVELLDAVSIVVATAPFGYLFGFLFVVHLGPSEPVAVWATTVAFSVAGLLLWAAVQS